MNVLVTLARLLLAAPSQESASIADDHQLCRAFQNGRTMGSQGVPAALLRVLRSTLDSTAPMHASAGPVGSPSAAGSSQLHSKGCSPAKQVQHLCSPCPQICPAFSHSVASD